MAETLVSYSLRVRRNDVVLLSGHPESEPLLDNLYQAVLHREARPVVSFAGDLQLETSVGVARPDELNPTGVPEGTAIDGSIGVWTLRARPGPPKQVDELAVQRQLIAQTEFLQHTSSGHMRWAVVMWPTEDAANFAGMSCDQLTKLICNASMLDESDPAQAWKSVAREQDRLCKKLSQARQLRITSPAGTDLTVGVSGRRWISGCGLSNLPDGEVFTGPGTDDVNGTWCSSFPVVFEGRVVVGTKLEISRGRIVRWSADQGEDTLTALLERDAGSSSVGEVGIGTNQRITNGTGISLLDEKIAGTAHVGLGASYPATGLTNASSVHRDFVCDLRSGGRILVDGVPLSLPALID